MFQEVAHLLSPLEIVIIILVFTRLYKTNRTKRKTVSGYVDVLLFETITKETRQKIYSNGLGGTKGGGRWGTKSAFVTELFLCWFQKIYYSILDFNCCFFARHVENVLEEAGMHGGIPESGGLQDTNNHTSSIETRVARYDLKY